MKNNRTKRIIAGVTALLVTLGIFASIVFAEKNQSANADTESTSVVTPLSNSTDNPSKKNETVYVFTDGSGAKTKTLVSDWLSNKKASFALNDLTDLKDIKNVKGNEAFKDGKWEANGNDIYYQGTSDKELPVGVNIKYYLDDKEISAKDIVGKSGKVRIEYKYDSNVKKTVTIVGKSQEQYVPFLMMTGMIVENTSFKNVEVTGGKLINDGDKSVIIGYGIPHINDMLKGVEDIVSIPSEFSITADVTKFSLDTTYTVATNEIFSEISSKTNTSSEKDKLLGLESKLTSALNQLFDGAGKLNTGLTDAYTGAGKLNSGLNEASKKIPELIKGVADLKNGANLIYENLNKINQGMGEFKTGMTTLENGATALNSGLQQISGKSVDIRTGAQQVIAQVKAQLKSGGVSANVVDSLTAANYDSTLSTVKSGLTEQANNLTDAKGLLDKIYGIASQPYNQTNVNAIGEVPEVKAQLQKAGYYPLTSATYAIVLPNVANGIIAQIGTQLSPLGITGLSKDTYAAILPTAANTINQKAGSIDTAKQSLMFGYGVIAYTNGVDTAATQVKGSLLPGVKQLVDKTKDLPGGISQLKDGSAQLAAGVGKLSTGADTLSSGVSQLANGSEQLVSGLSQLKDGSATLKNGIGELKTELTKALDTLSPLLKNASGLKEVAKQYNNFSGITEGTEGTVKFVFKTTVG